MKLRDVDPVLLYGVPASSVVGLFPGEELDCSEEGPHYESELRVKAGYVETVSTR